MTGPSSHAAGRLRFALIDGMGVRSAVFGFAMAGMSGIMALGAPRLALATEVASFSRSIEILEVRIEGRRRVARAMIVDILAREQLQAGTHVVWPDDPRVRAARDALIATGSFRRVTLRLLPVADRRDRGRLLVEIEERVSLEITRLHLASSKLTRFSGGLGLRERNLFGKRLQLSGGVVWGIRPEPRYLPEGQAQHAYELRLDAPALVRGSLGLSAGVLVQWASEPALTDPATALMPKRGHRRSFESIQFQRTGFSVGVGIPISSSFAVGVGWRFDAINAQLPRMVPQVWSLGSLETLPDSRLFERFGLHNGRHGLSVAEMSLTWDGRVERKALAIGGRFRVDVHLASNAIGSRYEYISVVLGSAYTWRLPWGHHITPKVVAGQIAGAPPRFERFHPGEMSDWSPGRTRGLAYALRRPFDLLGSGVDRIEFASIMGRVDLAYAIPLFTRRATAFVAGGRLFMSVGAFALAGNARERALARASGVWAVPVGIDANLGLEFDTAIGSIELSVGNVMQRLPL